MLLVCCISAFANVLPAHYGCNAGRASKNSWDLAPAGSTAAHLLHCRYEASWVFVLTAIQSMRTLISFVHCRRLLVSVLAMFVRSGSRMLLLLLLDKLCRQASTARCARYSVMLDIFMVGMEGCARCDTNAASSVWYCACCGVCSVVRLPAASV